MALVSIGAGLGAVGKGSLSPSLSTQLIAPTAWGAIEISFPPNADLVKGFVTDYLSNARRNPLT